MRHTRGLKIEDLTPLVLGLVGCVGPAHSPLVDCRQLVLVVTPGWEARQGSLRCFSREAPGGQWQAAGPSIPVEVGRNGLGWGRGLHGPPPGYGPRKKEGDGRSPAGAFHLSRAFGYAPAAEASFIRLPYLQAGPGLECVDDPRSRHYNRLLDGNRVRRRDWRSSERMRRRDNLYQWGILVDHNRPGTVAGEGSCIFLHIWEGEGRGTSGCTAMAAADLLRLLAWLMPDANPVLVQLPRAECIRYSDNWGLPSP